MKTIVLYVLGFISVNVSGQNYCLRFFGNGTNDIDRVKIPLDNPHREIDIGLSFTIEFQIKANLEDNPLGGSAIEGYNDDWTLGHIIIDRDIYGAGDYGDYGISLVSGRIAFGINNGSDSYTMISNAIVADGDWHFVAFTRDHISGEMRVFIDGNLDKAVMSGIFGDISYRDGRNTEWPNDSYLVIGAEKHDYDNTTYPSFNGFFDELRFSDIVRYSSNYTPVIRFSGDQNTIALYHFDEGEGIIVHESSNSQTSLLNGIIHFGGNPAGPLWVLNDFQSIVEKPNSLRWFYPNPVQNFLFVERYDGDYSEIFDILGNVVIRFDGKSTDVSGLKAGIYFLRVGDLNSRFVKIP